jgi:hypothetical protein
VRRGKMKMTSLGLLLRDPSVFVAVYRETREHPWSYRLRHMGTLAQGIADSAEALEAACADFVQRMAVEAAIVK